MDDSDRKRKQAYLKKEILDMGYDREEFAEFMLNEKEDGLNVDNWEDRDLIMIVDEFISSHKPVANANNDIIYEEEKGSYSNEPSRMDTNTEYNDTKYQYDDEEYPGDTTYKEDDERQERDGYDALHTNAEEDKVFDDFHRGSEKILALKRQQEEEREKIKEKEREEERRILKQKKREERASRKTKKESKKAKKSDKDEKNAEQKAKLEYELEEALKGEFTSKKFADMGPKSHIEYKDKKEKVKGVQLTKTKLNEEADVKIVVGSAELNDEGFFGGKHLIFQVETSPLGWKVPRKDKDFNFFRDYLVKAFPHLLVPAVPEYHSAKIIDKNFMRKRESLLNRFMNKVMMQEELKACKMVVDFLTMPDYKQLSKLLRKECENYPKLEFVHEYPTLSGEHKVNVTKRAELFCNQMEKYYSSHEVLFKKFHYLGKKLSSDLMEVSKTLCAISLCTQHISVLYELGNSKEMADTYQKVREHFKKWGKDVHNEAKLNLKYLPQYFNYCSLENQAYKDMFNQRNSVLDKFIKKSNELDAKKERLFKTGRADKWELSAEDTKRSAELIKDKFEALKVMLPAETKQVDDYENTYLYLTSQCYKEIRKINREDVDDLKEHLQDYASRMSEALTEGHLTWADFETAVQEASLEDSGQTASQSQA